MENGRAALVTGAGGFIGHHLTTYLKAQGYWVRGVDLKEPEFAPTRADEFLLLDLRRWENCAAGRARAWRRCTTWRRTWAASGSSSTTRP